MAETRRTKAVFQIKENCCAQCKIYHLYEPTSLHTYVYVNMCVCVCVCAYTMQRSRVCRQQYASVKETQVSRQW